MRVLMLDGGDRTPYLSRLVARLAEEGVGMCYVGDPQWKDFDALEQAGVRCFDLEIRHKLDFRARRRVRGILAEQEIDAIHTITSRDAYVGLKARPRDRKVRAFVRRGAYSPLSRFDLAERLIVGPKGATKIITVSRHLADHMIERGVDASRVTPVYTGIWSDELTPIDRDLRAEHGIDAGAFLIGMVGQWRPIKGFDYLLDALEMLAKRGPAFHLLVAGSGYEGQRSEVEGRGLADRITFLGRLTDVMEFTPNVDCVVVPSRIDALPRAAIEATVVGTPVIARSVGGLPEILDEGRAGVLVDPKRPAALAAALEKAIGDPASLKSLADVALERNRVLFSIDGCVERHLKLYDG